ncbi:MAG: acyltransferase [Lachnospiraceae bacterium]
MMDSTYRVQDRVLWVDTLKCMGIFVIYLGHFLDGAGFIYKFACMYVVQLFFFASGFFALRHIGTSTMKETILSKCKHILLPYFTFSILSLMVQGIHDNLDIASLLPMVRQAVGGIRNQLYAPALWFLPCLFVVSILFDLICRIVHKPWIVMSVATLIYACAVNLLPFDATETPRWFFNIDSALYYLFYYALGAVLYPILLRFDWTKIRQWQGKKRCLTLIGIGVTGSIAVVVSLLTFFGRKDYFYLYPFFARIPFLTWSYPIFIAMSIIFVNLWIAKRLQVFPMLQAMGKNTLLLCGNEAMIKLLVPALMAIAGLQIQLTNPLSAYLYAFILMLLVNYVIIPIEKKIIPGFLGYRRKTQ